MNRVLNFAVVAMSAVIMTSSRVDAAVVNITEGSTNGYTMTDGNTYVIQNSVSFSNSILGGSGMTVEDGATVVIYVPAGVTLIATGANGSGRTGGGAGIRVPETTTLIITGEGTVNATGGNAGNGTNGSNGGDSSVGKGYCIMGEGGAGGAGGGGAGAGIGGCGGQGGNGGIGVRNTGTDMLGNIGGDGGDGETMGMVHLIGQIRVFSAKGNDGDYGRKGNAGRRAFSKSSSSSSTYDWVIGAGGGGGGGGAGSSPILSIGGGGSGAGGGGSARKGYQGYYSSSYDYSGEGGRGGESSTHAGESANKSDDYRGGPGGVAGTGGGEGTLCVATTATVNVERETMLITTHPAAQYTVTLDANGGEFSSSVDPVVATLGCELPEDIPVPRKGVARFVGWAYDQDGVLMATSAYTMPSNTTLYAVWEPLRPIFTPESGTMFDNSLSVSISCPADGATIHYTTDGSEPTADSPVYRRFRINGRTTVKAIAEEDGILSDIVTAEYALGQCADPVITPNDGATFD